MFYTYLLFYAKFVRDMRDGYEPMDVRDAVAEDGSTSCRRARRTEDDGRAPVAARTSSILKPVGLKGGASEKGALALVNELQGLFEEPIENLMIEVLDEYGRDDDGAGRGLYKLNAYWSPMVK